MQSVEQPATLLRNLRTAKNVSLLLIGVWIGGCSNDSAEYLLSDYRERLARTLKQENIEPLEIRSVRRPQRRDLTLELSDQRIGILEFIRLYNCQLGQVIGERNSVLGRVAPASQRVFIELDFLRFAPACVSLLRSRENHELADKLENAHAVKRKELPRLLWQATLGSDEFSKLWRIPQHLGEFPEGGEGNVQDSLAEVEYWVKRWLGGDYSYDSKAFETALGRIRHGRAGYLLSAATLLESHLEAANSVIEDRLVRRPICFQGKPNPRGRILLNVVQTFFVGGVQRWAADVNRLYYQIIQPHKRLEEHFSEIQPTLYKQWASSRDHQLMWLQKATRTHVESIKPLLASCGLQPGG